MIVRRFVPLVALLLLVSCSGTRPANLGVHEGVFAPCPSSPNCVSSDATDEAHAIAPLAAATPGDEWQEVRAAVLALPRTVVVVETGDYLHAECSSAVMGFVDDLELRLHPGDRTVAVRSASRVGYSDMGVNRARVESLRAALAATSSR